MSMRTATSTPADLGGSGWYEILPEPAPPRILRGRQTADWVAVGAGFAGLAAARRLSQLRPGERIIVLEAQRVCWGAAGRNSGFMIDLPHELSSDHYGGSRERDLKQIQMNRIGIRFAAESAEEFGLDSSFDPCGKFHGAATEHGLQSLRSFERDLASLGESYESLDSASMKRITGTDFYVGGTFTPGAVMIQPAGYVR